MLLKFAYTWRGCLVAPLVILAAVCFWSEYEYDGLLWPLGLLLFLGGWALQVWAQPHVGYRLKTAKALTTSGPYALVRNPIYLGNTPLVLGLAVLSELVWLVPVAGLWCAGDYALVIRHEERQLRARYGAAYRTYQAAVPRWRPRVMPAWASGGGRAHLLQALRVECHIGLLLAPVVLKEFLLARFLE